MPAHHQQQRAVGVVDEFETRDVREAEATGEQIADDREGPVDCQRNEDV